MCDLANSTVWLWNHHSVHSEQNCRGFWLDGCKKKKVLSAYADDVSVLRTQNDVNTLAHNLAIYEKVISERLNWGKSEGYIMGKWQNQGPSILPGIFKWGRTLKKYLGVHMGTLRDQLG